jgi:CRP-like cAMP-binding protein
VATEPSALAVINDKAFVYLAHETPMFALQVTRSMAQRIGARSPGLASPPAPQPVG